MSDQATVKGFTPEQMPPFNLHRERGPVRAVGLTFLDKIEIVMWCLIGLGITLFGVSALLAVTTGVPQ